jgi:hypothetical protein
MAELVTFDCFQLDLGLGKHNFASHTLKFCLTNSAPVQATDDELADITQVSLTNLGGTHTISVTSWTETAGVANLVVGDVDETASADVGPFRWIVVYNDTTSGKPLIGYIDLGSSQTIASTKHLELVQTGGVPVLKIKRAA